MIGLGSDKNNDAKMMMVIRKVTTTKMMMMMAIVFSVPSMVGGKHQVQGMKARSVELP